MLDQLRFACRQLNRNRGFAAIVVATLALAVGVNTGVFSVVHAVLLKPLPYVEADRLMAICESNPGQGLDRYVTSLASYSDWSRQSGTFEEMAAATLLAPATLISEGGPRQVQVGAISANFFRLLRVEPLLGRTFRKDEETPELGSVVILSEALWRGHFAADPSVLNRTVQLGDHAFTVVGVMPARTKLFDPSGVQGWQSGFAKSEVWRPLPVESGLKRQRSYRSFLVLGRLKKEVSQLAARTEMSVIAGQQARDYPDSHAGWTADVQPWRSTIGRSAQSVLLLLFVASFFVFALAMANLTNLSLARAVTRRDEFAVRTAIGAGSLNLLGQLLTEGLLLSALGGGIGFLLAAWSTSLLTQFVPLEIPRMEEIQISGPVFCFGFGLCAIATLIMGLTPLLTLRRRKDAASALFGSRGSTPSRPIGRLRSAMAILQIALAIVLLVATGTLLRSLAHLNRVDPGFKTIDRYALDINIGGRSYSEASKRIQFVEKLLSRSKEQAELEAFGAVDGLPLDSGSSSMEIAITSIDGMPPAMAHGKLVATLRIASPDYFDALGLRKTAGRFFGTADHSNAPPVVLINEAMARRCFPGANPVGRRILSPDLGQEPCEIVGVIADVKQSRLDLSPAPEVYRCMLQDCFSTVTLVFRTRSLERAVATVRKEVAAIDPLVSVSRLRNLDDLLDTSLAPKRFALILMAVFAGTSMVLACIGTYGVLSNMVNERTREFGTRLAVGAQRSQVVGLVVGHGARLLCFGVILGFLGLLMVRPLLRSLLFQVTSFDPLSVMMVLLLVGLVSVLGCWAPARRVCALDPVAALRDDRS